MTVCYSITLHNRCKVDQTLIVEANYEDSSELINMNHIEPESCNGEIELRVKFKAAGDKTTVYVYFSPNQKIWWKE